MSRRSRTRAPARAAKELSFLPALDDTEPLDDETDQRDDSTRSEAAHDQPSLGGGGDGLPIARVAPGSLT